MEYCNLSVGFLVNLRSEIPDKIMASSGKDKQIYTVAIKHANFKICTRSLIHKQEILLSQNRNVRKLLKIWLECFKRPPYEWAILFPIMSMYCK